MAIRSGQGKIAAAPCAARFVRITGVVQGVGFRPFIYRLADRYGLTGWVRNTSSGVEITAEADPETLAEFVETITREAPPLALIETLESDEIPCTGEFDAFDILSSHAEESAYQLISPDMATCDDCRQELFDPDDRRYRYPFTNCTNCGPRFTIIQAIPYDRPSTTMGVFPMCPDCQAEYDDPLDRRFHAQPNACPVCGPHITLRDRSGATVTERDEAMRRVAELLRQGAIVAIKGLGGYQLACDATNTEAVERLRKRKRRPHKAFAIMVADLDEAAHHVTWNEAERELLISPNAPIVLLKGRDGASVAPAVAPGMDTLGVMLPYTPLHHILLRDVKRPLVMTSGNISEEPIAQDNPEALERLNDIADYFLTHNRGIHSRYDDSVWYTHRGVDDEILTAPARRARGYAPFPVRLAVTTRPILAMGPELKATFCLTRDRYAFVSQHIGDMQNMETVEHYTQTLALYRDLFDVEPELVAGDMHPDYHTTRMAAEREQPVIRVQHHHAHMAAALAEHGLDEPVIGVTWDGTGYGLDGRIWGGEFLVGDARGFERAAHLQYVPLPGGDAATQKPYRIAWAYLAALLGHDNAPALDIPEAEREIISQMISQEIRTPLTSSAGRLFDAVSALLGIRRTISYEAQAAMELEAAARPVMRESDTADYYGWDMNHDPQVQRWGRTGQRADHTLVIGLEPLIRDILRDQQRRIPVGEIAARFHRTMAEMIVSVCRDIRQETGLDKVILSGGVFQNRLLLEMTLPRLAAEGFETLTHRLVPSNDGGVALGQALVAHYTDSER